MPRASVKKFKQHPGCQLEALGQERLAELDQMFYSVQEAFREMLEIYSDEQLATIADFLTRSAQRSQEFIASQLGKQGES